MPSNALATAAFLVLAPSVALAAVPALRPTHHAAPAPRTPATSGTAPPVDTAGTTGAGQPPAAPLAAGSSGDERWIWPLSPRPVVLRRFVVGPYRWSPG